MRFAVNAVRHSELVFDLDFYPREQIDQERVEQLAEALRTGATLPPIIIDSRFRLVDGYHRARAHRLVAGEDALIPCETREYETDDEFFLDAVRHNATHGKPLTDADRGYTVALAERLGVSPAQLASILNVRTERVMSLRGTSRPAGAAVVPQPRETRRPSEPSEKTSYGGPGSGPRPSAGLPEINRVIVALQSGRMNLGDRAIRQSLENLARVIEERLEEAA